MQQAAVGEGLSFDPRPFEQDRLTTTEVDVSRGEIAQALVVAGVVVVLDKSPDLGLRSPGRQHFPSRMRFLSVWCQRSISPLGPVGVISFLVGLIVRCVRVLHNLP